MSGLKTKEVDSSITPASGGGGSKTLEPGEQEVTLHAIELSQYSQMAKDKNGYYVVLRLEGPDMGPEFEGFFIDNDDHSKGRHKGKVASVKTYKWPYADGKHGEKEFFRDVDILRDLKRICEAAGCVDWFDAQDGKHATIEDLAAEFNKSCPAIGKVFRIPIAGRQYLKDGYKRWDLLLVPYEKDKVVFELASIPKDQSKLVQFDSNKVEHMELVKKTAAEEFAGDSGTEVADNADEDFAV